MARMCLNEKRREGAGPLPSSLRLSSVPMPQYSSSPAQGHSTQTHTGQMRPCLKTRAGAQLHSGIYILREEKAILYSASHPLSVKCQCCGYVMFTNPIDCMAPTAFAFLMCSVFFLFFFLFFYFLKPSTRVAMQFRSQSFYRPRGPCYDYTLGCWIGQIMVWNDTVRWSKGCSVQNTDTSITGMERVAFLQCV